MSHKKITWEVKKLQIIGTKIFTNLTLEEQANLELEKLRFFNDEILKALKNG